KEGEFFKYIDPLTVLKYAIAYLPRTGGSLCSMSWGVVAFLCAFVLLWQNDFAFKDRRHKPKTGPSVAAASPEQKEDAKPDDNAAAEEAQPAAPENVAPPRDVNVIDLLGADKPLKERRLSNTECVVIGYVPDPKDPSRIGQLVLGTRAEGGAITY